MIRSIPSLDDPDVVADIAPTSNGLVCIRIRHHFVGVPGIMVHANRFFALLDGHINWIDDETVAPGHSLWADLRSDGTIGLDVRIYRGDDVFGIPKAFFDKAAVLEAATYPPSPAH